MNWVPGSQATRCMLDGLIRCIAGALLGMSLSSCHTIPESHVVQTLPSRPVVPEGTAIVAIRWPMVITEPALDIVERRFDAAMYRSRASIPEGFRRISQHSTYYALELHAYLRAYLGADAVLLEPYVVTPGKEKGSLDYQPIFESNLPVAFAVDIVEPPATAICCLGGWGDLVWTSFRISVAPAASPKTCGLLGASGFKPHAFAEIVEAKPIVDERCTSGTVRQGPTYTFMDYLSEAPPKIIADVPVANGLPLRPNAVVAWPPPRVWLAKDYVQRSVRQSFSANAESPDNSWMGLIARAIVQAAATMDLQALTSGTWLNYTAYYDSNIGEGDSTKLRAIRVLAQAEKQWVGKQNEKIAEALLNGTFGKSFRQQRATEMNIRERQSSQSMASAMSTFQLGMNTGMFGGNVARNPTAMLQGMTQDLAARFEAQRAMTDYIQQELGPEAAARDQIVQVDIAGVARQINADSRSTLRAQLKQLYLERFLNAGR